MNQVFIFLVPKGLSPDEFQQVLKEFQLLSRTDPPLKNVNPTELPAPIQSPLWTWFVPGDALGRDR